MATLNRDNGIKQGGVAPTPESNAERLEECEWRL